ncbi:MAG: glycosyltransferase family 2 protein [Chitinophagaceae bacterium]
MTNYPLISIITPSFNQGSFIGETILSVIDQDYPAIEYIIIDGGSTDDTIAVIKKYEDRINFWVSEPDKGQPDAINKGLKRATGDIIAFINSDDVYEPGAFRFIAEQFQLGHQWMMGAVINFRIETGESELVTQQADGNLLNWLIRNNRNHQPGNFWSRSVFEKVGLMDESLHYSFDWDYWLKFITHQCVPSVYNNRTLARFRLHNESKTVKFWYKFNQEYVFLINKYKKYLPASDLKKADDEVKKLLVHEKILLGRIESINGSFKNAFSSFKAAYKISPSVLFTKKFLFEFCKAMLYMPVRKTIS